MSGALHKTMVFFGLAHDDRAAGHDLVEDDEEMAVEHHHAGSTRERDIESYGAEVTPLPSRPMAVVSHTGDDLRRITTVHPRNYNDAKCIGESFREGIPVILNLTELDDAEAKRLVDFSAGLIFGLHGSIERVTSKVFLLSPASVEITSEESDLTHGDLAQGFFNHS